MTGVLLQRLASWALQCYFALCRQCQFLCPSFLISSVLFVRLVCGRLRPRCLRSWGVFPCPVGGLVRHMGHLMCCVRPPARFSLSGPAPFHHIVMALPIRLRCPPPLSPSLSLYSVFVWSHLPASIRGLSALISSPAVLVGSLFLVRVVIFSSRRLGLRFPSGHPSTWLLWLLSVPPPHPPFLGASVALLAPSPLPFPRCHPSSASPCHASERVRFPSPTPS